MNIVIVSPDDVRDGTARLGARAREHILRVLRKGPGDVVRVAIRGGSSYLGTLIEVDPIATVALDEELPPIAEGPRAHLLVALPRPKAVSRLVQTAASLGAASLTFIDAWKVDKAYFDSPRLAPERLDDDALLGAEQGGHARVPAVRVARGFRRFVEDELPTLHPGESVRCVFDPAATTDLRDSFPVLRGAGEFVLAFGPEGGFVEAERESFERSGFRRVSLRTPILTTEIAVATALGQLALLWFPSP